MKSIKLIFSLLALAGLFTFTSCGDDDTAEGPDPVDDTILSGSIGSRVLDPNVIYTINGFAYVGEGDELTIPAGTIIKAETGDGAASSALVVAKGGKLFANGNASSPVIFTSVDDDILPGETSSSLNVASDAGKWGGVILLGNAPVSTGDGDTEGVVEGVPASFEFAQYGGDDDSVNESSGSLNYVSIRFTGTELQPDEEIQGLTLGGVGRGTSISNIEIISSADDGVEFFGGNVDVTNILVARQQDDGIDIDQNYAGTVENALVLLYNPNGGNDGMEIDGPENETYSDGEYTIKDLTIYQKEGNANIARFKSGSQGSIMNASFRGFGEGEGFTFVSDRLTITDAEFPQTAWTCGSALSDIDDESENCQTNATALNPDATNVQFGVSNFTMGADESVFGWTFAKELELF